MKNYSKWAVYLRRYAVQLRTGNLLALLSLVVLAPLFSMPISQDAEVHKKREDYTGSKSCGSCHKQIYEKYMQTSMGRSMAAVTPELNKTLQLPGQYEDEKLDRRFEIYTQDGKLYQSEAQTDALGKEIFRDAHPLVWKIGAGENGFGLLTDRESFLFQAPLSFYAKPKSWGYSPGYEFADYGFSRPILEGCIVCHSGLARPVAGTNGKYENPPFSEAAIGCENCHGPGAQHIAAMRSHTAEAADKSTIVNPARLDAKLSDNICMLCHQSGDVRVLQPGKSYADFRPGMALDDVLAILKVQPTRESPPDDDHVEHYYSMTLSKCYRASGGALRCISCHDPHIQPSHEDAPAYFNKRCMSCHTSRSCTLPITARQRTAPADNCIGCHMPKRSIQTISHSSATNHRIVRKPGEAFPDIAFEQTNPSLSGVIHLDSTAGKEAQPLPLLTRLRAYGELAETKPVYVEPYLNVLDQLSKSQPDDTLVQAALGRKDLRGGDLGGAEKHLGRSLELEPVQPAVSGDMAEVLSKLGRAEEAVVYLRKAVAEDPFNPVLRKKLIVSYIGLKQYVEAKKAIEQYLEYFPQDSFMRQMLIRVQGQPTGH